MKQKTKMILGGCALSVAGMGAALFLFLWYVFPIIVLTPTSYTEAEMWEITHKWTRTAPIPPEATDVAITTDGSDFTRQFRARFRLSSSSRQSWITASPGFTDARVTVESDGSKVYEIEPGGGALWAKITIYPNGIIEIEAVWS